MCSNHVIISFINEDANILTAPLTPRLQLLVLPIGHPAQAELIESHQIQMYCRNLKNLPI